MEFLLLTMCMLMKIMQIIEIEAGLIHGILSMYMLTKMIEEMMD